MYVHTLEMNSGHECKVVFTLCSLIEVIKRNPKVYALSETTNCG